MFKDRFWGLPGSLQDLLGFYWILKKNLIWKAVDGRGRNPAFVKSVVDLGGQGSRIDFEVSGSFQNLARDSLSGFYIIVLFLLLMAWEGILKLFSQCWIRGFSGSFQDLSRDF